ncbi:BamA/TamA family outer membrane protein [Halomicronema sp. CCY15110]|uniref:BamA/TamA family outer membrane protein n=1 Tax=Halomicronema sp. CCY15110 TaxID=2767773 RepID=UPI0019521322|nr:BamA/TamA family outer membrane protein [Halomicronema sp. CCY15110]
MRQTHSLVALLTLSATLGIASQARGESLSTSAKTPHSPSISIAELTTAADTSNPFAIDTMRLDADIATLEQSATEESLAAGAIDTAETAAAKDSRLTLSELRPGATLVEVHQLGEATPATDAELAETAATARSAALEIGQATETDDAAPAPTETEALPEPTETEEDSSTELEEEASGETQVLVAEVAVTDPDGVAIDEDLEDTVYNAIDTRPGQTTTRSQIQEDINNIFATGFFSNVRAVPTDTPLGVRVTYVVNPNPVLTQVEVEGGDVIPNEVVEEIFSPQYGEIINLLEFQDGILELNNWYQDNGYVLAQVIAAPEVSEDGVVTLQVAEGVIEDINVQFLTEEGLAEDEEGNPINGKTHDYIVLREFETEPGDVFQQSQIQSDLQRVFGLGIFDDVTIELNPGQKDPREVDVTVNVIERNTGSVAAGIGFNFTGDLFGTLSYRQDNFGGNNQKFSAEAQLSFRDILFDVSFTDPWIAGDPYRTSYTLNGFGRRSISLVFDGGDNEIDLANGDRVRVNRFGSGVTFRRPLDNGWSASLGTLYQRVRTTDGDGEIVTRDVGPDQIPGTADDNQLTLSDTGADDLWTVQFSVVQDQRNNSLTPTSGSVLRLGTEQSIPLGSGSIFFNRVRASYSYYFPVSFLNFNEGPQALAINVQGGSIIGDFPPYEAFSIGGTNSVRGYDEGELGTGQSYLQASLEYRFPVFSFIGGALFLDAGTDLGTGNDVIGSPGPDRGKPGSGFGYGAGVRVQTPLGPIRVDYGFSDEGDGRLHFGIGERF